MELCEVMCYEAYVLMAFLYLYGSMGLIIMDHMMPKDGSRKKTRDFVNWASLDSYLY